MKKQLISVLLAGLASTVAFADGNDMQQNNQQSAPTMQAQPQMQSQAQAGQNDMNTQLNQNANAPAPDQAMQQDNNGSQD